MTASPAIYMQPLGTDFAQAVVEGLRARFADKPPHAIARVTLIVNTARMARRIERLFSRGPAGFQPRIVLITDVARLLRQTSLPDARPKLERHLQLAELVRRVLERHPGLGPRSALYPLSESLAKLIDEMQGEGVRAADIAQLDVSNQSEYWAFSQDLIAAADSYVAQISEGMDSEARQRAAVQALIAEWETTPPEDPILLVGSTGSRGTTALLMEAIARLEQGAVVLPGFDTHMPSAVWSKLRDALKSEDHPQFRFARFLERLGVDPKQVPVWHAVENVAEDRAALLSLALRPAPITDAWRTEADALPDLRNATQAVTLLETDTQREEALCIALRLRQAAEDGQKAALITPDRMLTRQVAAILDQWNIKPDDSAGLPLHLSAPGRLLRHTADVFLRPLDSELLLTLLKHPLTQSGGAAPNHGLFAQILEDLLREDSNPYPDAARLTALIAKAAGRKGTPEGMEAWGQWLSACLPFAPMQGARPLTDWLAAHQRVSEMLCAGDTTGSGGLWKKDAGETALAAITALEQSAEHAGEMPARDFVDLLNMVLAAGELRDPDEPHPGIMFWGTLEARVQGAELVILGSLNDGVWPEAVTADPWLNRKMRHEAGLLLPDRQIGLAAHDFQQAVCARQVWITRATKLDDAETVPSRWLNRLSNLMSGTEQRFGPQALTEMRARGQHWRGLARAFESVTQVPGASRAAPCPPVDARPRNFSVTEIKHLIRDPYAIYAKHCLRLRPLKPLVQEPNAPVKGNVFHHIMEVFIRDTLEDPTRLTRAHLLQVAEQVLTDRVPWPTARVQWLAALGRLADWFVAQELARRETGRPAVFEAEAKGSIALPAIGGMLTGVADRIDIETSAHTVRLYDYKSGQVPSSKQQRLFDKQLLLEAAIIEQGGVSALGPMKVALARFIGVGSKHVEVDAPLDKETPAETLAGLTALIAAYLNPDQHFTSRRMLMRDSDSGDYDHLARFGEWDDATDATPERVG